MPDPTAFLRIPRAKLAYRSPAVRQQDWDYIGEPLAEQRSQTMQQASRCMDCGVPFCQSDYGCPVENNIPNWNLLVADGRWGEALKALHATNNFPEFTGFLCPAPCESACVLARDEAAVSIRDVELQIIDQGFAAGQVLPQPPQRLTGKSVAIVGSGPAGLAAAQQLRRLGHKVTVFERAHKLGGLLRYGIPDFKMPKATIDRRLLQLQQEGVLFRCGVTIGQDLSLDELRRSFDAVCLAIGAEQKRELSLPGRELTGVIQAMPYLCEQNRVLGGELGALTLSATGKRVAVIGAGDTASDCIATALRQGASEVYELSWNEAPPLQRSIDTPWPQPPLMLKQSYAHDEGAKRVWNIKATHLSGTDGQLTHLHTMTTEGGRERLTAMPVDLVILAIGFTGVMVPFRSANPELKVKANGALVTTPTAMTTLPGVFAAGDATRGASLIVWAIAEGRKAAAGIHRYLV